MKFCCRAFEHLHGIAGTRGFGVFSEVSEIPAMFIIQHRALDSDGTPPPSCPSPPSLVSDLVIQFCPWCGVSLADFYYGIELQMERADLKVV